MEKWSKENAIFGFRERYRFLSNFYASPIEFKSIMYPTAEHAYQAQKFMHQKDRLTISYLETPKEAKLYGRKAILDVENWNENRISIMSKIVFKKFASIPILKRKLLATESKYLVEANYHNDRFWGTDMNGRGRNELGQILMRVRDSLSDF